MTHTAATRGNVVFPGRPVAVRRLIWVRLSPIGQENRWRRIISYLLCRFSPALMSCSPPVTPKRASAIPRIADRTHPQHHPHPTHNPWNPRPGNHSVVAAIAGICLSSTCLPPFSASLISVSPPKCISAWQTTWDFSSPLKSAASGKHSSPRNILVFKGIRDWGGNQPGNLLYSLCFLLVVNSADVFQGGGGGVFFFLLIVINRFLITRFIYPSSRQKHAPWGQLLLKDLFFFYFNT